jgi:hypothetical protein
MMDTRQFEGYCQRLELPEFGRALQATRRTVCDWAGGILRPSVSTLLLLECRLGIPALDWVSGVVPIADPSGRHEVTVDANRAVPRRFQPEVLGRQLRSIIEGNESPPPSLRAACERIGIHQTVAVRNAPELAGQILIRFRLFQTEQKIARQTSMKQVVASSVHRLLEEGRSLSFYELAKVLPAGVSTCDKLVLEEFNRLRREIKFSAEARRKPLTNA